MKLYFKGKNIDEMSKEELVKVIRWFYAHNIIIVEQFREEEDEG